MNLLKQCKFLEWQIDGINYHPSCHEDKLNSKHKSNEDDVTFGDLMVIEVPKKDKILAVVDLDSDDIPVENEKKCVVTEVTKNPVNVQNNQPVSKDLKINIINEVNDAKG